MLCRQEIQNRSMIKKKLVRSVLEKYWSRPFFASLWTSLAAWSINLQIKKKKKENETNIFPVRTEQVSSITSIYRHKKRVTWSKSTPTIPWVPGAILARAGARWYPGYSNQGQPKKIPCKDIRRNNRLPQIMDLSCALQKQ